MDTSSLLELHMIWVLEELQELVHVLWFVLSIMTNYIVEMLGIHLEL